MGVTGRTAYLRNRYTAVVEDVFSRQRPVTAPHKQRTRRHSVPPCVRQLLDSTARIPQKRKKNVPSFVAPMKCASQTWELFNEQPETHTRQNDLGHSVSAESLGKARLVFSNPTTKRSDLHAQNLKRASNSWIRHTTAAVHLNRHVGFRPSLNVRWPNGRNQWLWKNSPCSDPTSTSCSVIPQTAQTGYSCLPPMHVPLPARNPG